MASVQLVQPPPAWPVWLVFLGVAKAALGLPPDASYLWCGSLVPGNSALPRLTAGCLCPVGTPPNVVPALCCSQTQLSPVNRAAAASSSN